MKKEKKMTKQIDNIPFFYFSNFPKKIYYLIKSRKLFHNVIFNNTHTKKKRNQLYFFSVKILNLMLFTFSVKLGI